VGGGRAKKDQGDGIWLMDFIYLYETNKNPLAIALSGVERELRERDDVGSVNNVQYKTNLPPVQHIYPNKNFRIKKLYCCGL
jgi:hypothetical protein